MRKLLLVLLLLAQPVLAQASLSLRSGWNSLAFQGATVTRLGTVFGGTNPNVAGAAYWDGTQYVLLNANPQALNAAGGGRRGYWVFATQDTQVSAEASSDSAGNFVDLVPGYNLVSFATPTDFASSQLVAMVGNQNVPLGQVVLTSFTQINADNTYTSVDASGGGTLRAGRAYWIFSSSTVRLTWGAGPTPSPAGGQWSGTLVLTQQKPNRVGPQTYPANTTLNLAVNVSTSAGGALAVTGSFNASANSTSGLTLKTSASGPLNGNTAGNQTTVSGSLNANGQGSLTITAVLPATVQTEFVSPLGATLDVQATFALRRETNGSLTFVLPATNTPTNATSTTLTPTSL